MYLHDLFNFWCQNIMFLEVWACLVARFPPAFYFWNMSWQDVDPHSVSSAGRFQSLIWVFFLALRFISLWHPLTRS